MRDFNNITIIGNLVEDPTMRFSTEGKAVTRFRMAVNGWKEGEVDFIPVVCFGNVAEKAGEWLKKGKKALVMGRLRIKQYEKDGEKKSSTEIEASEIQMLSPKGE